MKIISLNLILSAIVTAVCVCMFFRSLSMDKFTKRLGILFIIIMTIMIFVNKMYFEVLTKNILNAVMIILISYLTVFKRDFAKSIYYSLIFIFINCVVEMVTTLILITVFKYSVTIYENSQYSILIFTIFNTLITYLISKIPLLRRLVQNFEKKLLSSNVTKLYIIISTIFIILLVTNNFINYEKNLDYYINFSMLVFVIMVSIIVLYNKIAKDKIENKYNRMMEYVSKYEQIINEQGKRNHEFNNQLMVINGYIGNSERLREYLNSIIKDSKGNKNYTIEQLSCFPDGGIKGLIYHKLSRMEDNKIRPYLYIDNSVKDIFETIFDVNTYSDIIKLFGVFLDNAIDASKEADKKEIEINMKVDDRYLLVTIENTYSKDTDIDKIGKKGFTTKGVGHGFGLSLVKDIARKNSKIETFNDINNNMFKQTIMVDLK